MTLAPPSAPSPLSSSCAASSCSAGAAPTRSDFAQTAFAQLAFALTLLFLVAQGLSACQSCGPKKLRRFGASCGRNSECAGGVCFEGRCTHSCKANADCGDGVCIENICHKPDTDLDGDGLSNSLELALKLSPSNPDTDGDGLFDGAEIGPNPAQPRDSNGDGIIDAAQSNTKDSDGDCMVDAIDVAPDDKNQTNLPSAKDICNQGVCAKAIEQVKVVCRKDAPLQKGVLLGCAGCGCKANLKAIPLWQASESRCDAQDNDCDGLIDEGLSWLGLPLGVTCQHPEGPCAAYDPDGKPIQGVVECNSAMEAGCSTGPGGSESLAEPERCDYIDNDCDGETDQGFEYEGKKVGESCNSCDKSSAICADGNPANPPTIVCDLMGTGAICSALTFASGFQKLSEGLPAPRSRWTATWSPTWKKLLLFGGQEPTTEGPVVHDTLWTLDTSGGASKWVLSQFQAPGRRHKATLVWDEAKKRVLLLGGLSDGTPVQTIWAMDGNDAWQAISGLGTSSDLRIPPLPLKLAGKWTRATILTAGNARQLVLWAEGLQTPWRVRLGVDGEDWKALKTSDVSGSGFQPLTGDIRCVASPSPTSSWAIALTGGSTTKLPAAYRLTLDPQGKITLSRLKGNVPARIRDACVIDNLGDLQLFGGEAPEQGSSGSWHTAKFAVSPLTDKTLIWSAHPLSKPLADALRRSDPTVAWDAKKERVIVAGGHQRLGSPGAWHRRGLLNALAWSPKDQSVSALNRASPSPRVGQATGHSTNFGLCIAGGLVLDLPDTDGAPARARPATDAWCVDAQGAWTLRSNSLAPYAFGISGIDDLNDKLIMASGYEVKADAAVPKLSHLWRGGLTFDENSADPAQPKVSDVFRVLDLKTGTLTTLSSNAPKLAASSVVSDPSHHRLISFGGFNNSQPTRELWLLDLLTMTFKQRGKKEGPMKAQYGSLLVYDPPSDVLIVAGGVQHNLNATGPDPITLQIMDANSTTYLGPCYGQADAPIWMTQLHGPAQFVLRTAPTWGDPQAKPPVQKLFRTHFAQPAFLPILFDPVGHRGWLALPDVRPPNSKDAQNNPCPGPKKTPFTAASVQLQLVLGHCNMQPQLFVETAPLSPAPTSMFLSSASYDHIGRRAWVWGGLRADGSSSSALWRIDQNCKESAP